MDSHVPKRTPGDFLISKLIRYLGTANQNSENLPQRVTVVSMGGSSNSDVSCHDFSCFELEAKRSCATVSSSPFVISVEFFLVFYVSSYLCLLCFN